MTDRAELDAMSGRARRIYDRLRRAAVERTVPDGTSHEAFTNELKASMRDGEFALSAMLQLDGGLRTAALEWLNGEKGPGYERTSAIVLLKNIGSEPVHYCAKAPIIASPDGRRGMAKATVNGRPVTAYDREYDMIEPGAQKAVPVGKAVTLLVNHSTLAHPASMRGRRTGRLVDVLREVGGRVSEYGSDVIEWTLDPAAAEPPKARAPRAPRGEEG